MKLPDVYSQRPTPRFGGGIELPAPVDPGTSGLGKSIANLGEVFIQEQIKDDKYAVMEAETQLEARILENRMGEQGWYHKKGNLEDTFYPDETKRFDQAADEVSKGLKNDAQRESFNRRVGIVRNRVNGNLISHATQQKKIARDEAYGSLLVMSGESASTNYGQPNEIKSILLKVDEATKLYAEENGITGPSLKELNLKNRSSIHSKVIGEAVDNDNYTYAKEWLKENSKFMTDKDKDIAEDLIKESGIKAESQAAVDSYINEGLSETEAHAKANKLAPELRDATNSRITSRYGEANRIQDSEQKTAGEQAWSIMAESGLDAVPLSLLRKMDGRERIALEKMAKGDGTTVKTDASTYYKLRQMVSDDPVRFKEENLMVYKPYLSQADFEEFVKLQTDDKKIPVIRSKAQIMKQGADDAGVPKSQIKQGFGDEIEQYYSRIDEELQVYQATTGKEPENKDIQDITDRLTIEVIKHPDWFMFKGGRPAIETEIEGVPQDMIDELALSVQQAGQPVTDENIKQLWDFMNGIQPEIKKEEKRRVGRFRE